MGEDAEPLEALVIGAGPAGLMAAEALAAAGHRVVVTEGRPSIARKLLMAGKSGLNLTRDEPAGRFLAVYGEAAGWLTPMLATFGPAAVQDWARGLGQDLFTGTTGRVFPVAMKASPLVRAWAGRLAAAGVALRTRWHWQGWDGAALAFATPSGAARLAPRATVLALGGASWPRLGSNASWVPWLAGRGVALTPFAPANAGVCVAWSPLMARHFGTPLKGVRLSAGNATSRGEVVIVARGLEGGGVYALTPALRAGAALTIDIAPDRDAGALAARLATGPRRDSISNRLRKAGLGPGAVALALECARPVPADPATLAARLKALPVPHAGPRPLAEAISSAGGIARAAFDDALMLRALPGTFAAGEMLDWEAPTGGYLLTACLATGLHAGRAAAAWGD